MPHQPKVSEFLGSPCSTGRPARVSFEYFPPRTDKAEESLKQALQTFSRQKPIFMDVTWGAGGTTHDKTPALCSYIKDNHGVVVNMHLTCTNMSEDKIHTALEYCKANGIRNIVALRGDPPAGQEWKATNDKFTCALDLVRHIRAAYGDHFCIAVAGYPEGHPNKIADAGRTSEEDMAAEVAYLKQKVDAGADYVITQLFYDNRHFLTFRKRCVDVGIKVPIIPGMLPPLSHAGVQRMVTLCKTDVPPAVKQRFDELQGDDVAFRQYGVQLITDMCRELMTQGVDHFHFYTLNLEPSTFAVMQNLGLMI